MLWNSASGVYSLASGIYGKAPEPMRRTAILMACVWFLVWFLSAVTFCSICTYVVHQRRAFWIRWKKGGEREKALNFEVVDQSPLLQKRSTRSFFGFPMLMKA